MVNEIFLKKLKINLSEDDFSAYLKCLENKDTHGFTINLRKLSKSTINLDYILSKFNAKVIFQDDNYAYLSYDKDELSISSVFPGKNPLYHVGLYYIQEPSAASVLKNVTFNDSDKVLDLCASPGGKSCEALYNLSKDKGGFLLANEYDFKRTKILSSNIERMGFDNCIITNNKTSDLVSYFPKYFDKVIVDAPCSGEGMFRKSEEARKQWSEALVDSCSRMQKEILDDAYLMLKEGGLLIYSTCTFSKEEDEMNIDYIVNRYNDLELIKMEKIYPFNSIGEGQFYGILKKKGECILSHASFLSKKQLKGLNVIKYDVETFIDNNGRKEPTHESTHIDSIVFDNVVELDDKEIVNYLHGEEIHKENLNSGFCKITYKNLGVGLGKVVGNRIKNHYPKGLRLLY